MLSQLFAKDFGMSYGSEYTVISYVCTVSTSNTVSTKEIVELNRSTACLVLYMIR